ERVRHRHLPHGQLTVRTVRQGDPPRPVLADLHRVPEAPVEVVELLRGVVRVDVDSPDDVASDHTVALEDRKSTRLNSSHVSSSYAVFCLKKKNEAMARSQQRKSQDDDEGST